MSGSDVAVVAAHRLAQIGYTTILTITFVVIGFIVLRAIWRRL